MKTVLTRLLVAVFGLIGSATSALSQDYPNRAVRILVGYPPSSGPDFIARTVGEALSKSFGQPFVMEYKPGVAGTLAAEQAAKAPADGYTLLIGDTGQLEVAPYLFKALPYDALRDLTPVAIVSRIPTIIASNGKSQIRTIKDLIREAKANPGKLNYGSSGNGSIHHIIFEALNAAAGTKMTHIPYKSAAQTMPALLSGDVDVMMGTTGMVAQSRAGAIHLLGVSSAERYPFAPDVPAVSETLNGFDFSAEFGILAPAKLPSEVLVRLSQAIKAATETQDLQDKYKKLGYILLWTTPEAYAEKIRQNLKKYEQVIRSAKIQAN